jgi:hypothetical protein
VGLFLRTSYFCSTRVWTQDLHLELLFQSFSWFFFSGVGSYELFAWAGFELRASWSLPPE